MRTLLVISLSAFVARNCCEPESETPEAGETLLEAARIATGTSGWFHVPNSSISLGGTCLWCPVQGGETMPGDSSGCHFTVHADTCTCIGDDPGEQFYGVPLGCYCHGIVNDDPVGPGCEGDNPISF